MRAVTNCNRCIISMLARSPQTPIRATWVIASTRLVPARKAQSSRTWAAILGVTPLRVRWLAVWGVRAIQARQPVFPSMELPAKKWPLLLERPLERLIGAKLRGQTMSPTLSVKTQIKDPSKYRQHNDFCLCKVEWGELKDRQVLQVWPRKSLQKCHKLLLYKQNSKDNSFNSIRIRNSKIRSPPNNTTTNNCFSNNSSSSSNSNRVCLSQITSPTTTSDKSSSSKKNS